MGLSRIKSSLLRSGGYYCSIPVCLCYVLYMSFRCNIVQQDRSAGDNNLPFLAIPSPFFLIALPSQYTHDPPQNSLTSMTGSFAPPISSDTATQPLPSSLLHPPNASSSTSATTISVTHSSTSSSESGTPTTPLVFPTPSATV